MFVEAALSVIVALITFSCAAPVDGLFTVMVGLVRSMPVICAERAKMVLFTMSRVRKQTYCPLYASSLRVMLSPEVYAVPSASLPMSVASQADAAMRYRVLPATASPVMTALTDFSCASPSAGSAICIVGAVRSMPVICAERVNETLPTVSRARKQTYRPLYDSSSRVMFVPAVYASPAVSVLISVASQVLLERAYLLPAAAASPAIAALTVFSCAVPAAGLVTDITGPTRSMPVICAERANETLPIESEARKQAY